jgi:LysM repeat protein
MLHMVRKVVILLAILLAALVLASCSGESSPPPISTLTIAPPQNPYTAKTSSAPAPSATTSIPTPQPPLLPTTTPFKHSVQPGDTLYSIALQYNISLDRLVSANPGVDTSILTIGMELVIPFSEEDNLTVPTPTPFQIPISDPICYPSRSGGAWCILLAENDQNRVLENISVAINLYGSDQDLLESFIAIPPLNYFFPNQSLPLAVYIESNLPGSYQTRSVLLTSMTSETSQPGSEITQQFFRYRAENRIADISGSVKSPKSILKGKEIWIAAVAFSDGNPVGIRKWISTQDLVTDQEIPFEFVLYSLGPPIDEIKLYSELH